MKNTALKLVVVHNGEPKTTSLLVAEKFKKDHKMVLRKIDALIKTQPEFTERNFTLSEFVDPTGRRLRMMEMTEEGFAMIAMRFTAGQLFSPS
jgi:Rha family phage regulatory protein